MRGAGKKKSYALTKYRVTKLVHIFDTGVQFDFFSKQSGFTILSFSCFFIIVFLALNIRHSLKLSYETAIHLETLI